MPSVFDGFGNKPTIFREYLFLRRFLHRFLHFFRKHRSLFSMQATDFFYFCFKILWTKRDESTKNLRKHHIFDCTYATGSSGTASCVTIKFSTHFCCCWFFISCFLSHFLFNSFSRGFQCEWNAPKRFSRARLKDCIHLVMLQLSVIECYVHHVDTTTN